MHGGLGGNPYGAAAFSMERDTRAATTKTYWLTGFPSYRDVHPFTFRFLTGHGAIRQLFAIKPTQVSPAEMQHLYQLPEHPYSYVIKLVNRILVRGGGEKRNVR